MQLASTRRGVVLHAVALQDYMKDLLQELLEDMSGWKIFFGHTLDVQRLRFNFNLAVNRPNFDTATVAQVIDGTQPQKARGHPSL